MLRSLVFAFCFLSTLTAHAGVCESAERFGAKVFVVKQGMSYSEYIAEEGRAPDPLVSRIERAIFFDSSIDTIQKARNYARTGSK